jgi:hypothetical protein
MNEPSTPPTPHTTNALLEILYKKADWELEEKLRKAAEAFEAVIRPIGMPGWFSMSTTKNAGEAIAELERDLFKAIKDKNRQKYVEDWMNKNNQVLAMLREFESQQA